MKKLVNKILVLTAICALLTMHTTFAQTSSRTKISYKVDSKPTSPIAEESVRMTGKLALDYETGDIEGLSLNVPLISFLGSRAGYLARIGNATTNPDMNFISNTVTKKGDKWEVKGELEFRKKFKPITISLKRQDKDSKIILVGTFQLVTADYATGRTSSDMDTPKMPFQFTMVFDKPNTISQGETLSTN